MKNIASALVKAQKAFGPALKTSTNPHFRSRYADLSACVESVITGLNDNGIALIQQTHDSESGVCVETLFLHESGESLSAGKLHVPATKQDAQGVGSAVTYLRRYSLAAICSITQEDDDGESAKEVGISKAQLVAIQTNAEKNAEMIEKALNYFKVADLNKLSQSQANIIINKLN